MAFTTEGLFNSHVLQPFCAQRFNYFIVYLVLCLHEVFPGWIAKEKFFEV